MENYTDALFEDLQLTEDISPLAIMQNYKEKYLVELNELLSDFMISGNRIAITFDNFDKWNNYAQTHGEDIIYKAYYEIMSAIIKSKYNRNSTDAQLSVKDRINVFKAVGRKEIKILNYLQTIFPKWGFHFLGATFNDINEHYYLFSGYGYDIPDISTGFGLDRVQSEILIDVKSIVMPENSSAHNADFIIKYRGSLNSSLEIALIDNSDFNTIKEYSNELVRGNIADNKKLAMLALEKKLPLNTFIKI